jgi:hypothetical protein
MKFADAPRLPKLPFILIDIALLAAAGFIAARHSDPLTPLPLLSITGLVVAGAAVFMIPYLVNDGRDQDDAAMTLRDELSEQFKRLIAASEHLQHATVKLKSIEESSTKSVATAEALPYRLQEKIADFNRQLGEAGDKEKAMIEHELARLRSGETELLTKVADQVAQILAGWAKSEADARLQFAESLAREKEAFERQLASVRSAESQRLAAATDEITRALAGLMKIEGDARQQFSSAGELQEKITRLLSAVSEKIASLEAAVDAAVKAAERIQNVSSAPAIVLPVSPMPGADAPVGDRPEPTACAVETPPSAGAESVPVSARRPIVIPDWRAFLEPAAASAESAPQAETAPAPAEISAAVDPIPAIPEAIQPPEAPAAIEAGVETATTEPAAATPAPDLEAAATPEPTVPASPAPEPASEPASAPEQPAVVAASAQDDATAPAGPAAAEEDEQDASEPLAPAPDDDAPAVAPKPRKPRAPRKPKVEAAAPTMPAAEPVSMSEPAPEIAVATPPPVELISEPIVDEAPEPENFSQVPPEENKPAGNPTSDGRTRLTVTSYIGIGNKLYLRGEGPGLSQTKGVPLQFVSIGRWRWETDAATAPVICRIYKNDKLEAPTGPLILTPGTEQEVSAAF